jgi:hypothetical protein
LAQVIGVAKDKTAKIMVFAREENLRSAEFDANAPSNGSVEPFRAIPRKASARFSTPSIKTIGCMTRETVPPTARRPIHFENVN